MSSSEALPRSVLYSDSIALTSTTFLSGISWGIMTSLYSVCMYNLIRTLRSANATSTKKTALLAAWITVLWILSSLATLANAISTVYAYSWQMGYPEGPVAYVDDAWNKPLPVLAVTASTLTTWFADAMMLWRLVIFQHGSHRFIRGLILSFGFLVYLSILGTGSAMFALVSFDQTLYSAYAQKFIIPYFALSVTLNVFVTASISTRLLLFKRTMERVLGISMQPRKPSSNWSAVSLLLAGRKEAQTSPYTSTVAMLIESAALYATWSLVFIVLYAMNNPGEYVMLLPLYNVQVISSVMIVYRVSKGLGWEPTTSAHWTTRSQMAFADVTRDTQQHDKLTAVVVFTTPTQ